MLARRRHDDRIVDAAVALEVPSDADLTDAGVLLDRIAPRITERFREIDPDGGEIQWSVEADPEHSAHALRSITRRAGITLRTSFDTNFLRSSDWRRLCALSAQSEAIGGNAGFRIETADSEPELVSTAPRLLERLLEIAKKGLSIQRYKGLGEMNPDQLAETTMDPMRRTLLQVKIEDAIEADDVFTKLMGDDVEPRRDFIEKNALNVQNLDI
jgi:DNA gyrase subunit B